MTQTVATGGDETGREESTSRPVAVLYVLGRERAYHFVTFVLVMLMIVCAGLALRYPTDRMLDDFGSLARGRLFQLGIACIGVLPIAGWFWWMRRYVRRLAWDAATREVELEWFGYVGDRVVRYRADDIVGASFHEGKLSLPRAPSVDAPYLKLELRGRRPLIIDLQGRLTDPAALEAILEGREPE